MSKSSKISFSVTLAGECTINEKHCTFYAIHRACTWFYCPKQHNDALNVHKITNIRAKSQTYGRSTGDFPKTTWVHWISVKLSCSRMFQITVQWFKNLNFVAVLSIFNFQPFKVLWVDFVILQCCLCLKSHSFDWLMIIPAVRLTVRLTVRVDHPPSPPPYGNGVVIFWFFQNM